MFTKDGTFAVPSAEAFAQADEDTAILAYTHGTMDDGRPYYAYVAVKPSLYQEFYRKSAAREPIVIGQYGTVVEGGFEASPPPDVQQRMRELGFDEKLEEKLTQAAKKQLKAIHERQEVERIQGIVEMLRAKQS